MLFKIWDLATFDCLKTLEGHKGYVHALEAAPDYLVSGSGDKTIKVKDVGYKCSGNLVLWPYLGMGGYIIEWRRSMLGTCETLAVQSLA